MKPSSRRIRRALWLSATAATAAGLTVAGVASSVAAQQTSLSSTTSNTGPGYPPPGGIYAPFTNCPITNPLMQESPPSSDPASGGVSFAACTAGEVTSGTLKIGNIITKVVQPVNVQFGFFPPPNGAFGGDNTTGLTPSPAVLPPRAGLSALLVTKPDLVPESLLKALGCPSSNSTVETLCQKAAHLGGKYLKIFGLAQSAGQLTNFGLLSWTQRMKVQLINPLLGNNCYIGTDQNPVVVNPQLSVGPGGGLTVEPDPNPAKHPDTEVLKITKAIATDNTFFAPAVTGCGPGGLANIAVDEAIDTSAGLPAASGSNSLTLKGTFAVAVSFAGEDSSLSQPQNNAQIVLSAFKASVGTPRSVNSGRSPPRWTPLARFSRPMGSPSAPRPAASPARWPTRPWPAGTVRRTATISAVSRSCGTTGRA